MSDHLGPTIGWSSPGSGDMPVPDFRRVSAPEQAPEPQPAALPDALAAAQQADALWRHEQELIRPIAAQAEALRRRATAARQETARVRGWSWGGILLGGVVVGGLGALAYLAVRDSRRARRDHQPRRRQRDEGEQEGGDR